MSTQLQNFYKTTITRNWTATTGDFNVSVKPTVSSGYLVVSPNNATLREIIRYTATGTNAYGDFVRVSNIADRGVGGTSAQTHTIGETVRMNVTAEHWQEMIDDIDSIVAAGAPNASTTTRGIVEEATIEEVKSFTDIGSTGAKLFVTPSTAKEYFPYYISNIYPTTCVYTGYSDVPVSPSISGASIWFNPIDSRPSYLNPATSDWTAMDAIASYINIGDYIYIWGYDTGTSPYPYKLLRYSKSNLSAGPTEITFAGAKVFVATTNLPRVTSDGTYFYFNYDAGNSVDSFKLAKFSLSGTVLTYVSTITCGASAIDSFVVKQSGTIYATASGANILYEFSSDGTLLNTYPSVLYSTSTRLFNIKDIIYYGLNATGVSGLTKTNL